MPSNLNSFPARVRRELRRLGDPHRAAGQQAYMKSVMPYHGVSTPLLRTICQRIFADLELPSREIWRDHVLSLWRGAKYREERYVAIELTGHKLARPFQTPAAMSLYEEIIVTGAWWDYVDSVASSRVGAILRDYPAPMKRKMLAWSKSDNIWKRRTSIICQLGFKEQTDFRLLYACIEGIFSQEGDRLGAAPIRVDRSGGSEALRQEEPLSP